MELADLKTVPKFEHIRSFFIWMTRTKPGQSDRTRCVGTSTREFDIVARILKLETGYEFPKADREIMKRVRTTLYP